MNTLISLFIDDELDLEEKITFVEKTSTDRSFSDETIALLNQEKLIRSAVAEPVPFLEFKTADRWKRAILSFMRPVGVLASGVAAAVLLFFYFAPEHKPCPISNRFVIYRPEANHVEITGSFTEWEKIPMEKVGGSGYWEITLALSAGEHRFTYILDGQTKFLDPTVSSREKDDFGGLNSILSVGGTV